MNSCEGLVSGNTTQCDVNCRMALIALISTIEGERLMEVCHAIYRTSVIWGLRLGFLRTYKALALINDYVNICQCPYQYQLRRLTDAGMLSDLIGNYNTLFWLIGTQINVWYKEPVLVLTFKKFNTSLIDKPFQCECEDEDCREQKARVEPCRSSVQSLVSPNSIVSCTTAGYVCMSDPGCNTALQYYNTNCQAMFEGNFLAYKCFLLLF